MQDFLNINKDWFFKRYFKNLNKRYWTFKIALNIFLQRGGEIIVETGSQRAPEDWGGGCSTTIFGDFCKKFDKHLYTIDNDLKTIEFVRQETIEFKSNITYELSDSVEWLKKFSDLIDLLYLDSLDCKEAANDLNIEAQTHALNELKAAENKLWKNTIILIDDNLFANGGKTAMCKKWLRNHGWICLMDYKQTLWIRE